MHFVGAYIEIEGGLYAGLSSSRASSLVADIEQQSLGLDLCVFVQLACCASRVQEFAKGVHCGNAMRLAVPMRRRLHSLGSDPHRREACSALAGRSMGGQPR